MTAPDEITPAEAGLLLGVSPRTVSRWADEGILTPSRVLPSGYRRFSRAAVMELKATMEQGNTATQTETPEGES